MKTTRKKVGGNMLMPSTRFTDAYDGHFYHYEDYSHLFDLLVSGSVKPFQGKAGFSSMVKLTDKLDDSSQPFAVIWRSDKMPIILHLSPTNTSDNVFNVGIRVVPPAIAHASIEFIIGEDVDTRPVTDYEVKHNHYLLHEIAFRAGLALCYESIKYDNETVRMLCVVEDDMDYKTAIDTESYPTTDTNIEIIGVGYIHGDGSYRPESTVKFDAKFFPQEFAELDEFADGYLPPEEPVIEKVEPYLDTRVPLTWGTSDYWVEMIRCDKCGQRVILGLTKVQCPDGQPNVSFACKACKTTIKHL